MKHLISNISHESLIEWSKGPQDTPMPQVRTFCRAALGSTWRSFDQWQQGAKLKDTCPACAARAEGHMKVMHMILSGAERARKESNGEA